MYVGGHLNNDGTNTSELCGNIRIAMKDVSTLQRLGSRANVAIQRKIAYFKSLFLARLIDGIDGM